MKTLMRKRLFSHGGSKSIDLPAQFVKRLSTDTVYLEEKDNCLVIYPEDSLSSMETDPMFAQFVEGLFVDALAHPAKLKDVLEIWDNEWDKLLENVDDEEE